MKWDERKRIKKEMREAIKQISHWYKELEKLSLGDIRADRIKSEINRLRSIYNDRQIILLSSRIFWLYVCFLILLIGFGVSFFVKPQIQFNLTISFVGVIAISSMLAILVNHWLSKDDRKAKRDRDYAEARYLESQTK